MGPLLSELRLAVRRLATEPSFTLPAVTTIAAGLGAATAILALVNGVLVRPLPYPDSDRIVEIAHRAPNLGLSGHGSNQLYSLYRRESSSLDEIGAYMQTVVNVTRPGEPEQIDVALTTPSVFSILGVQPDLGRLFTKEEGLPGGPTYVVISHGLWLTRFGGDQAAVGKLIELNGRPREIVGVMPAGFEFPSRSTEVWYNFGPDPLAGSATDLDLRTIGRAKAGLAARHVQIDLQRVLDAHRDSLTDSERKLLASLQPAVVPLKETVVGDLRDPLLILLAGVGLLLLVAAANVVNLYLLRGHARRRGMAVRQALGAHRAAIRTYWFVEALVVSSAGGLLGAAAAAVAVAAQFGFRQGAIPRLDEVRMDSATLAACGLLVLLIAIAIVAALELHGRSVRTAPALAGGRGADVSPSEQRLQRTLVAAQVAFALVMLLASATAVRGLQRVLDIELGFNHENVVALTVRLPFSAYRSYADATGFHEIFLDRVAGIPGVVSVGLVSNTPLSQIPDSFDAPIHTDSAAAGEPETRAIFLHATPSYFRTMGIPLLAGKLFEASDAQDGVTPVLISRSLAAHLAGDPAAAAGMRLQGGSGRKPPFVVTGVVGDAVGERLTAPPGRIVFLPVMGDLPRDLPSSGTPRLTTTVVRTSIDPSSLVPSIRSILRSIDPSLPLAAAETMQSVVDTARARHRLTALLMLTGAATTMFLGVVGIYAAASYAAGRRTREFAIRIALGATAPAIRRLVVGGVVSVLLVGVSAGLVAYLTTARYLVSLAHGVDPADVTTIVAVVFLLAAAALAAAVLPANRAAKADPARIIGSE